MYMFFNLFEEFCRKCRPANWLKTIRKTGQKCAKIPLQNSPEKTEISNQPERQKQENCWKQQEKPYTFFCLVVRLCFEAIRMTVRWRSVLDYRMEVRCV